MIKSERTFNVTVKTTKRTRCYAVLANSITEAERVISDWMYEQNFANPEITSIKQTGDILVKVEDD